jgi:hypothetical protein
MRTALPVLFLAAACHGGPVDPVLPAGNFAVVTTSGGVMAGGAVNTIRLSDRMVVEGLDTTIDQDNTVRVQHGQAYVVNRTPGTVFVYDVSNWRAPLQIATGDTAVAHAGSNPQDVAPLPGTTRAYVTLAGNPAANALGVLDTAQPQAGVTKWIALPTADADTDGKPEPGQMYFCDGKVYVSMGDYDETTFAPTGPGRLAVLDASSDTLLGFITLATQAPNQIAAESSDCNDVLVAGAGPFGKAPDGTAGIERVDLARRKSLGVVVSDTAMQGRPSTVSVYTRTLAFSAIYFDLEPQPSSDMPILSSTKVIAFNPTSGKILGDVTGKAPFIPFAVVSPDGELAVGVDAYPGGINAGKLGSGLYLGKADGTMLPSTPIDLGQAPMAIAFQ